MNPRRRAWFAAKTYGYGAGLPIRWEGWATLALFLSGVIGAHLLLRGPARIACTLILIAAFVGLVADRTEGGWRWRWGRER